MKTEILGVKIDSLTEKEVVEAILRAIEDQKKLWIVTPNPEFVVAAQKDKFFRELLNQADLALPDGFGLVLASRLLGCKPPLKKRVSGADVVGQILRIAPAKGWRIGVAGARGGDEKEGTNLIGKLKNKYPNLQIESLEGELEGKTKYDFVFACQGMKRQEKWIWENLNKINTSIFIGVGGSLDFFSGLTPRAPLWMRKMGMEWLWRLGLRPRTHPRRVYNALVIFNWLVLRRKLGYRG
ncbi:MAG: WecB/TagA/CpsF family glycosyltransferase [bacterium]|nr:WecB/TagA/CpsF family glycosyltransferase [bacterium]